MYEDPVKLGSRGCRSESTVDSSVLLREQQASGRRILQQRNNKWAERSAERREYLTSKECDITHVVPYGGILSSGINIASTTIGSGILSMPAAFHYSGMNMGVLYLIAFGGLTILSYTLLGLAAMRTGYRNYGEIVHALMGPAAALFCAVSLIGDSFATLLSYVSSISSIFEVFFAESHGNPYLQTAGAHRFFTTMLWLLLMLPLGMPRAINSLKFLSLFAIVLMSVFSIFVVVHCAKSDLSVEQLNNLVYWNSGNSAVSGLTTFIFAYGSQSNSYNIFQEFYEPSVQRLTLSATLSVIIALTMYLLVGVFGYVEFGAAAASGSPLNMYDPLHDPMMAAGYVFIAFKLCVSYGLYVISLRSALYYMVGIDLDKLDARVHVFFMGVCCTLSLVIGLFVPQVSTALDIVGGCFGGFNAYIFPALLAMYTGEWTVKSVGMGYYFGSFSLLLVGVVAVVFSTVSAVYDTFH